MSVIYIWESICDDKDSMLDCRNIGVTNINERVVKGGNAKIMDALGIYTFALRFTVHHKSPKEQL